jgi:hypothetical protein
MTQPFTVAGAILELHAARAALGVSPGVNAPAFITTFDDTSGVGNDGTLTNFAGTAASGWAGAGTVADPYRLVFDPTAPGDYVSCPDLSAAEDKTFSYEAWIMSTTAAGVYIISESQAVSTTQSLVFLALVAGKARISTIDDANAQKSVDSAVTLNDGLPHHVVGTCDGTDLKMYLDGAASGTPTTVSAGTITLTNAFVGARKRGAGAADGFFPGAVILARIHPGALTPGQVAQNYAAGTGWAEVTTTAVSDITSSSASCGGTVLPGGESATARGVCWNTAGTPTTADSKTTNGSGTGTFTSALTGLLADTTYHVRAYATSSAGTAYGAEVDFHTRAFAASVWNPPAKALPSLLIGSDVLGWQEFGAKSTLGVRTKAMPGGDGSLDFTVPGDFAMKHRNLLVPEAVVKLVVDGERDYGGLLTCDPLRHRLGAQDTVELVATGPWGMAGRKNRYSHVGIDPDLERWQQYRGIHERSGRFTVAKEECLELRASTDRSYDTDDACRLYYWVDDGLGDWLASGIVFEYQLHLPTSNWEASISVGPDPMTAAAGLALNNCYWQGALTVAAWTAVTSEASVSTNYIPCFMLNLYKVGATGSPATDPYIRVRFSNPAAPFVGGVCGYYVDPYTPDNSITVADVLAQLATDFGIAAGNQRITGLTTAVTEFMGRYPTNIAAVMEQATLLAAAPVEAYFDHDGSGFRFTANARPASVNVARNRLWSVTARDVRGLVRDWEATPEQVEVLYGVKEHATLPDGTVQAARYPASVTATYPLVESVDMTGEPPMTAALAAQYAETVYRARQDSLYSGDVDLGDTALTDGGQDVPTRKLKPGDRIGTPSLLDVDAAGLYVQAVSYDYRNERCVATVGEPWDPLGFRPRSAATRVLGSGGRGGGKSGGPGRRAPYLRRSGVA